MRGGRRRGVGPDDDHQIGLKSPDHLGGDMTKPPADSVTGHRVADGLAHNEPETGTAHAELRRVHVGVYHHGAATLPGTLAHHRREISGTVEPVRTGKHSPPRPGSGRQRRTALATTSRNDAATGAGPHTQTESVHLRTATVVRLEGPLALGHGWLLT